MVDISGRIDRIISEYIENGQYFTINRARQYGKTTTLYLLEKRLRENYIVLSLSFESADEYFQFTFQSGRRSYAGYRRLFERTKCG